MTEFPSSIEREVASSLLLLSSDPIVFSSPSSDRSGSEEGNRSLCGEIDGQVSMSFVSKRSCDSAISNSGSSYRKRSEDDFMNFKMVKGLHFYRLPFLSNADSHIHTLVLNDFYRAAPILMYSSKKSINSCF
ncbi:hypothetical protein DY000_02002324 [Brassica cretica]|uniref:Uncharacterized protein n=1 Tax=Brassica cretica TaxID=69181 RepID=A0ABQ7C1E4_BRACR|nr:hypothetical protein DY000_02002324 [Brassica cretica]